MNERLYFSVAALVALVSASLVWFSTLQGPGTTPDSLQYLFAAQDLLDGQSLRSLSHHWPPGYPLLISLPLALGLEPALALRALSTVIAAVNVVLFAACVRPLSGKPTVVALLATSGFALAPGVLSISIMALSEPPFLAFLLSALLALRASLQPGSRWALGIATICLACALFTRYSGIAFVGLAAAWLVFTRWRLSPMRAMLIGGGIFVSAVLPMVVWLLAGVEGNAPEAPRTFAFHPIDASHLLQSATVIGNWFQSQTMGVGLSALVILTSLCMVFGALRPGAESNADRAFAGFCLISSVGYVVFLFASISFFDYYTLIDVRTLWPALALIAIGIGICVARWAMAGPVRLGVAAVVLIAPLAAGLPELTRYASRDAREIPGYFNPGVCCTPVIPLVRRLPALAVHSNAPELVRLISGRRAQLLPAFRDQIRNTGLDDYVPRMESLLGDVESGRAVVVYFSALAWRDYLPDRSVFDRAGAGRLVYDGPDGWILVGETRSSMP